mmetsp:Transcript_22011/g.51997  ORF Transcript_22011/g.51997 Transcript_22011/m.51997 type:complete len:234 (-) Transcript_22011:1127-1828(-)
MCRGPPSRSARLDNPRPPCTWTRKSRACYSTSGRTTSTPRERHPSPEPPAFCSYRVRRWSYSTSRWCPTRSTCSRRRSCSASSNSRACYSRTCRTTSSESRTWRPRRAPWRSPRRAGPLSRPPCSSSPRVRRRRRSASGACRRIRPRRRSRSGRGGRRRRSPGSIACRRWRRRAPTTCRRRCTRPGWSLPGCTVTIRGRTGRRGSRNPFPRDRRGSTPSWRVPTRTRRSYSSG